MSWQRYDYYGDYDEYDDDYDDVDCDERETPPDAMILEGPIRAASRRGDFGKEWWGKQWVNAVERFYHDNRLQRGRTYARNGSVQRLEISYGSAYAPVQGSRPMPYCVEITLNPFANAEWEKALDALAGQALYSAKLLAGEMPGDIEALFQGVGLSLFPRSLKEIGFECTCPDDGDPCKHAAAVYYVLAEQLDTDPFVLFHLRGRTREQVLNALRQRRGEAIQRTPERTGEAPDSQPASAPVKPLDADLGAFWGVPVEPLEVSAPAVPTSPPLLRVLGDPPGDVARSLDAVYKAISKEALDWLGL